MKRSSRSLLSIFTVTMFTGFLCANVVSAQSFHGQVLRRMDLHNRSLTTLRAGVTMTQENTQLGTTDVKQGRALYAKGKKSDAYYRIDWEKPQESISVAEGQYMIFQPRNKIAYKGLVANTPKDQRATSILALLTMSRAQLNAAFDSKLKGQAKLSDGTDTKHLLLTPKTRIGYETAELWVDADGMPRQIKIIENKNSVTTFLFTGLKKNVKVDRSEFAIKLPSDTKIQKT